jgi:hypothetical protein
MFMEIVTLTTYSNSDSDYKLNVKYKINNGLIIGNLINKEYYRREKDGGFSYTMETMIITDIVSNGEVGIKVHPVTGLIKSGTEYTAIVNKYEEFLYYINGNWHTEDDIDKEIKCENVVVINPENSVRKTLISGSYLFEKDGVKVSPNKVEDVYKPDWCIAI